LWASPLNYLNLNGWTVLIVASRRAVTIVIVVITRRAITIVVDVVVRHAIAIVMP
jgi:hypothetical protein